MIAVVTLSAGDRFLSQGRGSWCGELDSLECGPGAPFFNRELASVLKMDRWLHASMAACIPVRAEILVSKVCCLRIGTAMAAASSSFQARDFQWVAQLPILWENNRAFRERSLNGQTLLRGISEPGHGDREVVVGNIVCCKMNNEVLKIVLKLMGDNGCIFVAKVYLLQAAALEFHSNSGYPEAASLGVVAHSDGWGFETHAELFEAQMDEEPDTSCISIIVSRMLICVS